MSSRVTASAVAVSAAMGTPGKRSAQTAQVLVLGPEGGAPLRDAVGFVDGEEGDGQACESRQHALGHQPLRGHVEEPRLARRCAAPGGDIPVAVVGGVMQSAATPASRSAATWSCIKAISGETTTVSPSLTSAGTWKQSDLPEPVGITVSA